MKRGNRNGFASTAERKRRKPQTVSVVGPDQTRNTTDPGDETQRNFRYQHSYGVILLIAARAGKKPYVAIWCEHHEDLLAERDDGRFDAYQIKTSRPEAGAWDMLEPDLMKSVGRFADLIQQFGDSIANVLFVSNTNFLKVTEASTDQRRRAKCPRAFLEHVRACNSPEDVALPYSAVFESIIAACACDPVVLMAVFRRMDVILGPSRDSFDAVLSHEHLGALPECQGLCVSELDVLRDELVAKVYRASSLQVTAPERHTRPLFRSADVDGDPVLAAKRLSVQNIELKPAALGHLGWQEIEIVDEDLGRTASGTVTRAGFERMVAEVCPEHVGAVATTSRRALCRGHQPP